MAQELESKANFVKIQIKKDFEALTEFELEELFANFRNDKRTLSFLGYYNRTVLDKERIDFGEFKYQWAIQGMTKKVISSFNDNFAQLKDEIQKERDIKEFFKKYCCEVRKEAAFCSKLFHTMLPNEFPPLDKAIKKKFHLQKEEFIRSILIIKCGYGFFIKENPNTINLIRRVLSKPQFAYLRVNELSNT